MILKRRRSPLKKLRKSANIADGHDFSSHGLCGSDFFPYICARQSIYF